MASGGQTCAPCLQRAPDHDGVRAAVAYGDVAREIVLKLKHGRRVGLAKTVGRAMARIMPAEPALLVPVPLHRWRIWHRGFNQSALIARHLAKGSHHQLMLDVLRRDRATPMLGGLGAKARTDALRGVFSVDPAQRDQLRGRTILLVDDVYTSGATANACSRTLKRAGAARVIIICWARVLRDDQQFD
jgi:ComF family protein